MKYRVTFELEAEDGPEDVKDYLVEFIVCDFPYDVKEESIKIEEVKP